MLPKVPVAKVKLVLNKFVLEAVVLKKLVEVACEVVARREVKF